MTLKLLKKVLVPISLTGQQLLQSYFLICPYARMHPYLLVRNPLNFHCVVRCKTFWVKRGQQPGELTPWTFHETYHTSLDMTCIFLQEFSVELYVSVNALDIYRWLSQFWLLFYFLQTENKIYFLPWSQFSVSNLTLLQDYPEPQRITPK